MERQILIPHLFRKEFSKITTVLCNRFGILHIETAEDIASETFLLALETWSYKGIPENQTAWLYTVAKNKAINHLKRNHLFSAKIATELKYRVPDSTEINIDLSDKNIKDSQLQMLFAICHPSISTEAQIGLALRVLCGFGIDEIATALLTNKETVNKRLLRAKEKLRKENIQLKLPSDEEIGKRLETVLTTLYLLFNEGYYSESHDAVLRKDLCLDAMRLTSILTEYEQTNRPVVNALLSLMCFHASRFEARNHQFGTLILYDEQDAEQWDQSLVAKGAMLLKQATCGTQISSYHIEACIAYWHTQKKDTTEKWENILQLYNQLLSEAYSPIASLNRIYAFSKVHGKVMAIEEAEKLDIKDNQYYFALLGYLYSGINNTTAKKYFQKTLTLAKTEVDKITIKKRLENLV